jgi:hypothetical protein
VEKSTKVALPSGAELEIRLSEFAVAWDLLQTLIAQTGDDKLSYMKIIANKEVEKKVIACLGVCQYNKLKISDVKETFEKEEARQDYITVLFEVAKENILPFTKALISKSPAPSESAVKGQG